MRAKKLLALLLTVLLIGGMLPTAFASDASSDMVSVTFDFSKDGRSDVTASGLETVNTSDYSSTWTAYKNFPENPATPAENWAYAGTTVKESASKSNFVNNEAPYDEKLYVGTGFTRANDQWLAFKIKVPKTSVYKLSDFTTFLYQNATPSLEVYMFPSDARFTEGNAIYGTIEAPTTEGSYAWRDGGTTFDALNIENAKLIGKVNEYAVKADRYIGAAPITDAKQISLTAGEEYILLLNNAGNGKAITVKSVTLTEVPEDERVLEGNLTPVYNFKLSSLKDPDSISKNLFLITSPEMINEENSSIWYVHSQLEHTNKQISTADMLVCSREANTISGNNALVLKIKTDVAGIYLPKITYDKGPNRGRIEFYAIPASEVSDNAMNTMPLVNEAISNANMVASIDQWQEEASEKGLTADGNPVYLDKGENYFVIKITKGSGESDNKNSYYYAYVEALSLTHSAGVIITDSVESLRMGKSATIKTKALNAKNKPVTDVVLESSDPSILSVSGNTITGVNGGTATVTAKIVVDGVTYTDSVEVEVFAPWDPIYSLTVGAVADESLIAIDDKGTKSTAITNITDESKINSDVSTGTWTYKAVQNFDTASLYANNTQMRADTSHHENNAVVLNAEIYSTGSYKAKITYTKSTANGITNLYAVPKTYAEAKGWNMEVPSGTIAAREDSTKPGSEVALIGRIDMNAVEGPYESGIFNLPEKEFYFLIQVERGSSTRTDGKAYTMIGNIALTKQVSIAAASADTTLEIGKTTEVSSKAYDNRDNEIAAEVTYENLTPSVVSLSGNTVTAVAVGDAKIKATATIDGATVTDIITIKVTPKKVTVATQIGNEFKVDSDIYMGDYYKVTAKEFEGKVFRHWVLGTEEHGIPVSNSAVYTFQAISNVYLTAVYSDVVPSDAKVVEFYAENGGFIASVVADENGKVELPEVPSLTGYVFSKWMTDAKTEFTTDTIVEDLLTKVVATYTAMAIGEKRYGDEVKNEASSAKVWKRDGNIVSYGTEYTYYVWEESEIEAVDGEKPATPIIVLDSRGKEGNARMIEYDANGFEIIEAGILFGKGSAMSVDSCMYKAKSKINANHGQFTAKPVNDEYNTARGYIIYKDGDDYKVVYSE